MENLDIEEIQDTMFSIYKKNSHSVVSINSS